MGVVVLRFGWGTHHSKIHKYDLGKYFFICGAKGQLISKPIYDLLTSPKNERTNLICLLFYSSRQTNQIRPFVFLENLRLANLPFEIN